MSINNMTKCNDQEDLEGDIFFCGHGLLRISTTTTKNPTIIKQKSSQNHYYRFQVLSIQVLTCTISDQSYSSF